MARDCFQPQRERPIVQTTATAEAIGPASPVVVAIAVAATAEVG